MKLRVGNKNSSECPVGVIKYFRWVFILMILVTCIIGFSSIFQIYAVSAFIDYACGLAVYGRWSRQAIGVVIVLAITIAIDWLMPRVNTILQTRAEVLLLNKYRPIVLEKCAKLKYEYLENDDKWNLISRVVKEPEVQWLNIYRSILELFRLGISIVGILFIIAKDVWWAAIVILFFCFPIFFYAVKGGKRNYQAKRDASEYNRQYSYYDSILNNKDALEERKLFGFTDRVQKKYDESFKKAFWIETQTAIQWAVKTKLSGGLSMVAALIIVITLISPTVDGKISIGMFMSLVNAVFLLTSQMSWGLSGNIDRIVAGNEYKKDVLKFFDLEEDDGALDEPIYNCGINKVEFRKVSFAYPGLDNNIIKEVSFILEKGKKYAFVGPNGAGKTTIVKLLLGIYSDYSGDILINDKNLKLYSKAEQKGLFSAVFQDYIKHSLSLRDNCEIAAKKGKKTDEKMSELLHRFELDNIIKELPDGINTMLGKVEKNGVELSGGQWQKLAMVRALLRPSEILILDEPTAALDPKMESEIYKMFQMLTHDRLTILISHRLGFARNADEIIVFNDGMVHEQGDFASLIEKKGLFTKMYNEQKRWYEE